MNWIAELGVILFTFNALAGPIWAAVLGLLYLFWSFLKTITAYRMAKKVYESSIKIDFYGGGKNGSKRNKK